MASRKKILKSSDYVRNILQKEKTKKSLLDIFAENFRARCRRDASLFLSPSVEKERLAVVLQKVSRLGKMDKPQFFFQLRTSTNTDHLAL